MAVTPDRHRENRSKMFQKRFENIFLLAFANSAGILYANNEFMIDVEKDLF